MASSARYDFGEQWDEYERRITGEDLETAKRALADLLPHGFDARGKSFLDIGCGSGIHSAAAANLGFSPITAVDYYEGSVRATQRMAQRMGACVATFQDDILNSKLWGRFDVVYSWGVLHHTGDMARAIDNAKALVSPGGLFIIAIYLKTPLCGFWKVEKRLYTLAPKFIRTAMDYVFRGLSIALKAVDGKAEKERGMDWRVGVKDWLGGCPYESATPKEVAALVGGGFALISSHHTQAGPGVLGTRCAEYVFRRSLT